MHHKVHLGNYRFPGVELAKLLVVIADQACQKGYVIFCDPRTEEPINDFHHPKEVVPALIVFWDVVANAGEGG